METERERIEENIRYLQRSHAAGTTFECSQERQRALHIYIVTKNSSVVILFFFIVKVSVWYTDHD